MTEENKDTLPRGCRIIEFPESVDSRGSLSFVQNREQIPFPIERVFWIHHVPEGKCRGSHSHCESSEVVVPVCGSFHMYISDGTRSITLLMDSPRKGILIPPGVWCELSDFAEGTVCVVFASHPYNADGYTHNYQEYVESQFRVVRYVPELKDEWDRFVRASKNGTFLLERGYMDYHSERFLDVSLMFYRKERLMGVLPANYVEKEARVESHGGLTYGGLILSEEILAVHALEIFSCAMDWMRCNLHAKEWIYKPIPYIYNTLPSEEDLYALFRCNGKLHYRAVSSVVDYKNRLEMRKLRKRGVSKAVQAGLNVQSSNLDSDLESFWSILEQVLVEKHHTKPVHTVSEMRLLGKRFPSNIHLFTVRKGSQTLAGCLVYESATVAHAQYIAANEEGKKLSALDLLFHHLINEVYTGKNFFDFGISTESGGSYLNEGLIFQKEGFGARSVVYDTYLLTL